ncbi:MAG: hypothetical protein HY738_14540 [Bacteroidia bacterium]|nr:hypothetical protein [Bacteroidia bacterium]
MIEKLKEIEDNFAVETIECKGFKVWPVLRVYIGFKLFHHKEQVKLKVTVLKSFIRSLFYGFHNLFRKYQYISFSDSMERKNINGMFFDKSMDYLIARTEKTLLFELPLPRHYKRRQVPTQYIISKSFLLFFTYIFSNLIHLGQIKNENIIKLILEKEGIQINYKGLIKRLIAEYTIMKILIRIYKPKAVFIQCPYTNIGIVKALRDKGVNVIEIQHGVISLTHTAYNIFKYVDNTCYPSFLLTFGNIEKKVFYFNNYYIDPNNILPVGNFYIDYISNEYKGDVRFREIARKYKIVVAVTSQVIIEEELIAFLIRAAQMQSDILYLYIPRYIETDYSEYFFPDNIKIFNWLNCYEIIVQSDFHSTVFSTCALEAPSLGVQNIFINLHNLSKKYYMNILNDHNISRYCSTAEEYVNTILHFVKKPGEIVKQTNSDVILSNYKENINNIIHKIIA